MLAPGFWLGGWAWNRVAAPLRAAGCEVRTLTLPGPRQPSTPRAGVTLDDHVRAVVDVLAERPARPAVLVGHSGAGVVVYAATDRAPHFVHRAVYVDSAPLPDGAAIRPDLAPGVVELPLPPWEELEAAGTSLAGLDERDLAEFRRRGVPHPAGPAREPLRLTDPRRYQVPVTLITSTFRPADIRRLAAAGHPFFAELPRLDATIVDLPTGHYPMWSRPEDLATELAKAADAAR